MLNTSNHKGRLLSKRLASSKKVKANKRSRLDLYSSRNHTYHALLIGNRLEWQGDAPKQIDGHALSVQVELLRVSPSLEQGKTMAVALQRLAELETFTGEKDPIVWEKAQRQERELPGRS